MKNKIKNRLWVLSAIFAVTSILVYWNQGTARVESIRPLKEFMHEIGGYTTVRNISLSEEAYKMLKLDDYVFVDFTKQNQKVNLYIGYYYTANKAYAAHSPLVCYQSQGWKIDAGPTTHYLDINENRVRYNEVITSYSNEKELVIYWYQSNLNTNTEAHMNKLTMAYNKLTKNDEQHAFVRVAVPFVASDYDTAKKNAMAFIGAFYPKFVDFIAD